MRKIALLLLFVCSVAAATHYHSWQKLSSSIVTGSYGQTVMQCQWECRDYTTGHRHYATTVGYDTNYCPMP